MSANYEKQKRYMSRLSGWKRIEAQIKQRHYNNRAGKKRRVTTKSNWAKKSKEEQDQILAEIDDEYQDKIDTALAEARQKHDTELAQVQAAAPSTSATLSTAPAASASTPATITPTITPTSIPDPTPAPDPVLIHPQNQSQIATGNIPAHISNYF